MNKIKQLLKKILPHGTFIFLKRLNKARHAFINDFCVVDNRKSFAKDLAGFVNNRHAIEACRYCYGTNEKPLIPAAIQME